MGRLFYPQISQISADYYLLYNAIPPLCGEEYL
jgi:hypothetical protein